jgi:hypothetical protein
VRVIFVPVKLRLIAVREAQRVFDYAAASAQVPGIVRDRKVTLEQACQGPKLAVRLRILAAQIGGPDATNVQLARAVGLKANTVRHYRMETWQFVGDTAPPLQGAYAGARPQPPPPPARYVAAPPVKRRRRRVPTNAVPRPARKPKAKVKG